ncbi:MAG: ClbS/DfsB family four-helix bundle protein [Paraclostridium bifermentans]|uniref:ClbS/DfsB family four-helix bundle protein n=1 Tax=Paraclostridium bifermentans TaxID=1490 RepID=UPI00241E6409|nr:ClbS/DfsB family four-helix bundle protein [Paraclostridium bifermentans]MBS5954520.1 ClbS/DfsB family four-helix bundle protein [Paraclostridium bifermentans]
MVEYKNREELILEISNRSKLFIDEFNCINEKDKDKLIDGVDKTPAQMIAYQLGWMNLILDWESKEQQGITVVTPTPDYKWNNLGGLYESFYKKYDVYTLVELCDMFVETEKKIIQLINAYTDIELFQQGERKWSSSTPSNWPIWKWIHINTVAPFKSFRTKIRKWKKLQQ